MYQSLLVRYLPRPPEAPSAVVRDALKSDDCPSERHSSDRSHCEVDLPSRPFIAHEAVSHALDNEHSTQRSFNAFRLNLSSRSLKSRYGSSRLR